MSKQTYITRYLLIIKRLQKSPASFKQIQSYLEMESEIRGLDFTLEVRTFQRELQQIRELFGLDIQFNRTEKMYMIVDKSDFDKQQNTRILEAYETLELLKVARHNENIFFENRKPDGMQHFYGLLHAIKNQKVINLCYHKFYEDEPCRRLLYPLALKESRGRWYLIAEGEKKGFVNPYGLDRVVDIEITNKTFQKSGSNVSEMFEHSFGIIRDKHSQKVRLSFSPSQGRYIKTFPLHHTQKEISADDAYVIDLNIFITHDFIMELLSLGCEVKVITPKSLANRVRDLHKKATELYN